MSVRASASADHAHPGKHLDGEPKRIVKSVPPGKRVLNIHISEAEMTWLKVRAAAQSVTVTTLVRNMLAREMTR